HRFQMVPGQELFLLWAADFRAQPSRPQSRYPQLRWKDCRVGSPAARRPSGATRRRSARLLELHRGRSFSQRASRTRSRAPLEALRPISSLCSLCPLWVCFSRGVAPETKSHLGSSANWSTASPADPPPRRTLRSAAFHTTEPVCSRNPFGVLLHRLARVP